jgi:hypothetical protein
VLAADGTATANLSSLNGGPIAGSRNRIINGDMRIDQRNAGASVSVTATGYPVDRFYINANSNGVISGQRSTTAPTGFTNSALMTVTTARTSIAASDVYGIRQTLEGFNTADLAWGTASAQTVTLSFWVRSSIAGTYAVSFFNGAFNRSYVATYTVNAANTFEYKTVTVAGDATGTWATDNTGSINVFWDLGSGSTYVGTAGLWSGSGLLRPSSSTNWISTNGATFYITGVQLEPGTVATPFERRSFGAELALCQRYYAKTYALGTVPGTATDTGAITSSSQAATAYASAGTWQFPVTMRATATVTIYSTNVANTTGKVSADSVDGTGVANFISDKNVFITRLNDSSGVGANTYIKAHAIASAEF